MASNKRPRSSQAYSTKVKVEKVDDPVPIKDDAVGKRSVSSKAYSTIVKKEKSYDPLPIKDDAVEHVSRTLRELPPADYIFHIKSFSLLSQTKERRYESDDFYSGGFTCKLCLYPNGNEKENGKGHISLYLAISETYEEVNVNFKLFVYDKVRNKYLTIQDANGRASRFNKLKTEWGFAKLISLDTFNDSSKGFLVDDSCTFGAEVLVNQALVRRDCLSVMKLPSNNIYTWEITGFSKVKCSWFSEFFSIGEHKGQIRVFPRGVLNEGNCLSIFLHVSKFRTFPRNQKIYVEFTLCIKDLLHDKHRKMKFHHWFCASSKLHGSHQIVSLADLHDKLRGFIVEDTLVVEVQIDLMAAVNGLPYKRRL